MTTCPRCGTGLLPTATICTACCYLLQAASSEPAAAMADVLPPAPADSVPADITTDVVSSEIPRGREALMHWPFGGADETTVREVIQADAEQSRPQPTPVAAAVSSQQPAALGIPTQRGAAFNPLTISSSSPPPNSYLAAERRQYAALKEAADEGLLASADG